MTICDNLQRHPASRRPTGLSTACPMPGRRKHRGATAPTLSKELQPVAASSFDDPLALPTDNPWNCPKILNILSPFALNLLGRIGLNN